MTPAKASVLLAALACATCSPATQQNVARGFSTGISAGAGLGPVGMVVGGVTGGLFGAAVSPDDSELAAAPPD